MSCGPGGLTLKAPLRSPQYSPGLNQKSLRRNVFGGCYFLVLPTSWEKKYSQVSDWVPNSQIGQKRGVSQVYFTPTSCHVMAVSYTHLRAHETPEHLVCRLLLEKKKQK